MCQKDERQEILQEGRSPCWYYSGSRQFLDIKIFFFWSVHFCSSSFRNSSKLIPPSLLVSVVSKSSRSLAGSCSKSFNS